MKYINGQYKNSYKETIDKAETYKEAKELIKEYKMAYLGTGFRVWLSQRKCK